VASVRRASNEELVRLREARSKADVTALATLLPVLAACRCVRTTTLHISREFYE